MTKLIDQIAINYGLYLLTGNPRFLHKFKISLNVFCLATYCERGVMLYAPTVGEVTRRLEVSK